MTEGIFALLGVALGWLGNAALERWRHSYIRTDARIDRQAATLRDAQAAIGDFMLAWSPLTSATALGNPPNLLAAAISGGPPGISYRNLLTVAERVHVEAIRDKMHKLAADEMALAKAPNLNAYTAVNTLQVELITEIGAELRKLEGSDVPSPKRTVTLRRWVVVAASIVIVVLALLVAYLVWHGNQPTDAVYVASNPHWGACTQTGQTVRCSAIATVTNQGGSRVARVQYLAFYLPDGSGCDADIPAIDPGTSRSLSCVVTMGSNFPPGTTGNQTPSDPPRAIVHP